jgi:hypothetical protein
MQLLIKEKPLKKMVTPYPATSLRTTIHLRLHLCLAMKTLHINAKSTTMSKTYLGFHHQRTTTRVDLEMDLKIMCRTKKSLGYRLCGYINKHNFEI